MLVEIKYNKGAVEVIIGDDEAETFQYEAEKEINLTDLVLRISEFTELSILSPSTFELFKETYSFDPDTLLKVTEYIYKILEAFNCSYAEVYPDNTEETDTELSD